MSSISIIGIGNMARAIGRAGDRGRQRRRGHRPRPGQGRRTWPPRSAAAPRPGTFGAAPAGDIVILAVPYAGVVPVVAQYGDALAGKVIIDITNPIQRRRQRAGHPRRHVRRAGDRQGRPRRARTS